MYSNLINTIIDKKNPDYSDFPDFTNGQVYISGNAKEGWHTRDNLTAEETQSRLQESVNREARAYLLSTDWYLTRQLETGTPIPEDIKLLRQQARERIK